MKPLLLACSLLTGLLGGLATPIQADPAASHQALQDIWRQASKAPSDPASCQAFLDQAVTAAEDLSSGGCSGGFSAGGIHGHLLAVRGLLRIGNVLLHRHGCAAKAREAMSSAHSLVAAAAPSCMPGPEQEATLEGLDQSIAASATTSEGIPAANPDLYPPPPGAPPPPPNHCLTESPNTATVYDTARSWADAGPLSGINPGAMPGGSVSCDPSDAANIWRALVRAKDGPTWLPDELVYVDISDWTCTQ